MTIETTDRNADPAQTRTLSEPDSKRIVAAYGVRLPEERLVPDPEAAVAAAAKPSGDRSVTCRLMLA